LQLEAAVEVVDAAKGPELARSGEEDFTGGAAAPRGVGPVAVVPEEEIDAEGE
jgi:hypothetical protein